MRLCVNQLALRRILCPLEQRGNNWESLQVRFTFFERAGWSAGWDIGTYEGERMVSRFGSYSSTRSHLSMLPGRHIGVVAMTTGRAASLATDIVAAFAYDLEAGRPDAHDRARARLDTLIAQVARAPRMVKQADSVRASRQQPMD